MTPTLRTVSPSVSAASCERTTAAYVPMPSAGAARTTASVSLPSRPSRTMPSSIAPALATEDMSRGQVGAGLRGQSQCLGERGVTDQRPRLVRKDPPEI